MMANTTTYPVPVPSPPGLSGQWYQWLAEGELRFQRCGDCSVWRHPPRLLCADCGSSAWDWVRSSGRGKLFSWTVSHRAFHPDFTEVVPYAIVVVEMDEGPRLVCSVRDIANEDLRLDLPVEIGMAAGLKGGALPYAKPRGD